MLVGRLFRFNHGPTSPTPRWLAVLLVVLAQTVFVVFTSGTKVRIGTEDTDIYHRYALHTLAGATPYHDFMVEYPPLALPLFVAPALVTRNLAAYKVVFAGEMLVCNAICVALVAGWVDRRTGRRQLWLALGWYSIYFAILSRLLITRYDAAPMLVGFASTLAWTATRRRQGGFMAAAGVFIKVYPVVLALVNVVADWRQRGRGWTRGLTAFALTMLVGAIAWLVLAGGPGLARSLRYQTDRGFEYGSLYAGGLMLVAWTTGGSIVTGRDHSSYSITTPASPGLLGWVPFIQAAVVIGVCVVSTRRSGHEPIRYASAAVVGLIAAGKVFSPQFLIWLIPLITVLEGQVGRRARWLFGAVVVSTLLAQGSLSHWPRTSLATILVFNARNVLVVWLWFVLIWTPTVADRP